MGYNLIHNDVINNYVIKIMSFTIAFELKFDRGFTRSPLVCTHDN